MGDQYPLVKLAAVQAAPCFLDRDKTVDKACRLIWEAGEKGADIIAFPEAYIPAFPHWFLFHKAGTREAMNFYKELFLNAVEVPGPDTEKIAAAAKKAGSYVVMGINEKEKGTMGTLYNSIVYFSPNGEILGKHRKLVPTDTERLIHGMGDGSTLKVIHTEFGPIGGLICGENTNSLARFALLAMGERIHIASWPAFAEKSKQFLHDAIDFRCRNHAFEGKVFVISVTGVFSEEMADMLCRDENDRQTLVNSGGHSSIINPRGEFIAGPASTDEEIIYADADLSQIINAKALHDITGHYNRFDIFGFSVNRKRLSVKDFLL